MTPPKPYRTTRGCSTRIWGTEVSDALDLEDIVAGYGRGDVLRGLSLHVPAGEITCLVGPNGSGKSTVLRVVSGLISPTRGRVRHSDVEISGLSPRTILERGVAHIPQDRGLFPAMSVWDNVLMGAYISGTGLRWRTEWKSSPRGSRSSESAVVPQPDRYQAASRRS